MLIETEKDPISPDQIDVIYFLCNKYPDMIVSIYKRWHIEHLSQMERSQFYPTLTWILDTLKIKE